ncbi:MAG: rod shape-determining protein MreC [Roseovarius sp.]|nr:rod shape-determining protein MreC [Roseovarius sp.]
MARNQESEQDFTGPLKRLFLAILLLLLIGIFILWRFDAPRVERFRTQIIDYVMPAFDWALSPAAVAANILYDFESYLRIYEQNMELRRELQKMKAWKEAALQLEQQNARLLDLNNVQLSSKFTWVSGVVLADSGSPFRQSVLINVGSRDGIIDGWAAMDALGLVGRISGVGKTTSRIILLTDPFSLIPVTIQPSGQKAILAGDNTVAPYLDFIEAAEQVKPGDRVITSGDGGVFPSDLLIGQVAQDSEGRMRVRLSADIGRLEFLRVLRNYGNEIISESGRLIAPDASPHPEIENMRRSSSERRDF